MTTYKNKFHLLGPGLFEYRSRVYLRLLIVVLLLLIYINSVDPCGPGRGYGFRKGPRKMTPLVFKQHVPSVSETTLGASGPPEGKISKGDPKMKKLVINYNKEIVFKDEEGTGADRIMSKRCKELLDALSVLVMNQWEGVRLRVTEAWDEDGHHAPESLHYEGRAVDITTDDRDRSKYGMLARLAVEVGFDWVYFESRGHVHCSVKSDSSITLRTGGCFSGDGVVQLESGELKQLTDVTVGDRVLAMDSKGRPIYDDVIAFLHRDSKLEVTFQNVQLSDGRNLTLTPDHLIYALSHTGSPEPIFASRLQPGYSLVYTHNISRIESPVLFDGPAGRFQAVGVEKIDLIRKTGVYSPLTNSGAIVINGVVSSCYASVNSHSLAHHSMVPLRLAAYLNGFSFQKHTQLTYSEAEGIHWFAEILYIIGRYILPPSYWFS